MEGVIIIREWPGGLCFFLEEVKVFFKEITISFGGGGLKILSGGGIEFFSKGVMCFRGD